MAGKATPAIGSENSGLASSQNEHVKDAGKMNSPIPQSGKRPISKIGIEPQSKRAKQSSGEEGVWDEDLHGSFVSAIFEIGLRNSSPAVILENMTQKPETINSERVKSKLQKYRNNKEKSKQEFMEEWDAFIQKAKAIEGSGATPGKSPLTSTMLEMMGSKKLLGGDAAAFLSYCVMKESESTSGDEDQGSGVSARLIRKGALEYVDNFAGAEVPFPELTEAEKRSSLGVSMTFVMGLFLSMTQHLAREREGDKPHSNSVMSAISDHQLGVLKGGKKPTNQLNPEKK